MKVPKDVRDYILPKHVVRHTGEGPSVSTPNHPDFPLLSSAGKTQGLPGGFASMSSHPERDVPGERAHPRYSGGKGT